MAAARDTDITLWLHNKLGISSDTWSESSLCSQLNAEVLRNIKDCFVELQTQVKLKLLLSYFHIPKRNVEEWRAELEEILEVAVGDSEPWVTMLAEIMKTYPTNGSLNLDIREPAENQRMTHDLILDMKKLVKKHSELGLLPMECNYLNRNAFLAAAGQQVPLTKHFALKRKPKAAALRAELLIRSGDAQANVKKNQLPAVPVRSRGFPRKTTDSIPMRGIPSRIPTSSLRTSGMNSTPLSRPLGRTNLNRKDGGIKLLEITESPIAVQQSKKRRKLHDSEANKAADTEKHHPVDENNKKTSTTASTNRTQPVSQPAPPVEPPPPVKVEPPTPDYAAGLAPSNPPTPSPVTSATPAMVTTHVNTLPLSSLTVRPPLPSVVTPGGRATPLQTLTPGRILIASSQPGTGQTILYRTVNSVAGSGYSHTDLVQAIPVSLATQSETSSVNSQPQYATLQPVQPDHIYPGGATQVIALTPSQLQQVIQQQAPPPLPQPVPLQSQQNNQPVQTQTTPQKRNLSLTKEQMLEAQEMFKTSNKVTRPEKALILGFMAGSRDNPCPHLGNIVTIKLSEREEMVNQPNGAVTNMLAETHFQMNYNSGEWKRIRKYRTLPE